MLVERKTIKEEDGTIGYYESIFNSSNILKTTYFPKAQRLYISFNRGGTYSYGNVTIEQFSDFENSESQGKYFIKNIKTQPKQHPYRKEFTLYPNEVNELKEIIENNKPEDDENN